MDNELYIESKKYISSRRAAEITKYSNDYIGQLCRSDKIKGTLVGRVRFVEEESLLTYYKKTNSKEQESKEKNRSDYGDIFLEQEYESPDSVEVDRRPSWINATLLTLIITVLAGAYFYAGAPRDRDNLLLAQAKFLAGDFFAFNPREFFSKAVIKTKDYVSNFINIIKNFALDIPIDKEKDLTISGPPAPTSEDGKIGIAVVPSSGEQNESIKKQIQESFSDEVKVAPDKTGTAGIIKPVFKNSEGEDYLYVLVPIKK